MKSESEESRVAKDMVSQEEAEESFLVFRIADQYLATSLSGVGEIVEYAPITYFPSPFSFFKGLVNLRGKILGIVDLADLMGVADSKPLFEGVFINLKLPSGAIGVMVDEVKETVQAKPQLVDFESGLTGENPQSAEVGYFKYEQIHVRAISLVKYVENQLNEFVKHQSA